MMKDFRVFDQQVERKCEGLVACCKEQGTIDKGQVIVLVCRLVRTRSHGFRFKLLKKPQHSAPKAKRTAQHFK
jgi:hypothetical protein